MSIASSQIASTSRAYILYNKVTHARFAPEESKHAFTYPTLALLLSLSSLEKGQLDLGRGWLFSYGGLWLRLSGIRASAYLHSGVAGNDDRPIMYKLHDVLTKHGCDANLLKDAWMMTMPSYMGFEGINPLTVYFCYNSEQTLWVVVLEIHNTFGERHVHVLPLGSNFENAKAPSGFTNSWTFARQFHVSPFNDRSGYYTCAVRPPSHPPSSPFSHEVATTSLPVVRIDLHTSDPRLQAPNALAMKLTATLRTTRSTPLTSRNLLLAVVKHPVTPFFSFPRIAYQAALLHYRKRLDVHVRPEPRAASESVEQMLGTTTNAVQSRDRDTVSGGGIGWQSEGLLDRHARKLAEEFLRRRATELDICIKLVFANAYNETQVYGPCIEQRDEKRTDSQAVTPPVLTMWIRSSRAFLVLFISPSASLALLLGRDSERLFSVSDDELFLDVFRPSLAPGIAAKDTHFNIALRNVARTIRLFPIPLSLRSPSSMATLIHPLDHLYLPSNGSFPFRSSIFYTIRLTLNILFLLAFYLTFYLEQAVFAVSKARFVVGDEPWDMWRRAEAKVLGQEG